LYTSNYPCLDIYLLKSLTGFVERSGGICDVGVATFGSRGVMKPPRILVLILALTAGAIAAYLASPSDQENAPAPAVVQIETVEVLVASNDLAVGTRLSGQDIGWQVWPAAAARANFFIRRNERPNAIEELAGSFFRQPFSAGDPIRESKLIKGRSSGYMAAILPEGMRALATDILPESSAGGFILPNDHVDVILTRRDKHAEKVTGIETFASAIVISNARVLAIDQSVEERAGGGRVIVGRTATLELTPSQAANFMRAKQMGTISLALRSVADFAAINTETGTP
jgi:pilus assembly protein CpaB